MKWFKNKKSFLLILPSFLVISLFIGYGLLRAGTESLTGSRSSYGTLFSMPEFYDSLMISLYVSFTSTIFALLFGLLITRFLFRFFDTVNWKYIVWIPMLIPHFVAAYLIYILFSQTGLVSLLLFHINGLELPFPFVNDTLYIGVILSYIWKEIPFVILMLLPVYQQLDSRYEDVVKTLGGSGWQVFWTVEIPWIGPVLLETGLIIFAFVISAYEIPALLGVTYPKMFSVVVYEWFYEGNWENRPLAQALMLLITFVLVIFSIITLRISKRWQKGR